MSSILRRLGAAQRGGSPESRAALDELREKVEKDEQFGEGVPSVSTAGFTYVRTDVPSIYYKINGTWTLFGDVS